MVRNACAVRPLSDQQDGPNHRSSKNEESKLGWQVRLRPLRHSDPPKRQQGNQTPAVDFRSLGCANGRLARGRSLCMLGSQV